MTCIEIYISPSSQTNICKGADNPTYLKETSNISFGLAIAGLTSGILFILNGLKNMSN